MYLRNSKILNDPFTSQGRTSSPVNTQDPESAPRSDYETHSMAELDQSITERAPTPPAEDSDDVKMKRLLNVMQTLAINDSHFTPKTFTGTEKDTEKTERWLEYFNNYTAFRGIDDDAKLKLFKLLMTGQAAEWIRSLPEDITGNLQLLTQEFRQRFSLTDITRWQKATSMWTREQGVKESVDAYITDIINMARIVPITDQELVRFAIIKGLKSTIKVQVLLTSPTSVDEVTRIARIAEAAEAASSKPVDDISAISTQMTEMINIMKSNAASNQPNTSTVNTPTPSQRQRSPSPAPRRVQFDERQPSQYPNRSPSWERPPRDTNGRRVSPPHHWTTQESGTPSWNQQPQRWTGMSNRQPQQHLQQGQYTQSELRNNVCTRCGLSHNPNHCKAINSCCYKCGQPGHYSRMCMSNTRPQYPQQYAGNRQH